jgi:hypothetical protein
MRFAAARFIALSGYLNIHITGRLHGAGAGSTFPTIILD